MYFAAPSAPAWPVTAYPPPPNPAPSAYIAFNDAVRAYVGRTFAAENRVEAVCRRELEFKLKEIITEAATMNRLESTDWSSYPLPQQLILEQRKRAALDPLLSYSAPVPVSIPAHSSVKPHVESSLRKRKSSEMANDQDNDVRQKHDDRQKNDDRQQPFSKSHASLEQRKKRFEDARCGSHSPTTPHLARSHTPDRPAIGPVVGRCQKLEKNYFRLTAPPNAEDVRPLEVLRQTLELLKTKWRRDENYTYICDQLKSLRQDLTVQHIKNDFTTTVYETHARIALEKGDLGEYNQCQTQLRSLYKQKLGGHPVEFKAYRILYFIHTRNRTDMNDVLSELTPADKKEPAIKHALDVRSALALGNYHKFFKLYLAVPGMGAYLMDMFVERERLAALSAISKAYKPDVKLRFVTEELGFENDEEAAQFILDHAGQAAAELLQEKGGVVGLLTGRAGQTFEAARAAAFGQPHHRRPKGAPTLGADQAIPAPGRRSRGGSDPLHTQTPSSLRLWHSSVCGTSASLPTDRSYCPADVGDMKAIRRSLKNDKDQQHQRLPQPHLSLTAKSAVAIVPPKKVIKALYDYQPHDASGQQLAFHKGDFFHVISREDDSEWYEACNPLVQSARGLVPVAYFEVIGKQQRQSGQSSNPEWFVAKPIGRLGGPGLIPVSFVDIKDTLTMQSVPDRLDAVRKAGVPRVEEWKRFAAEYKNSSISLGKFDNGVAQTQSMQPHQQPHSNLPLAPVSASVPRYCFDNDTYWYIIECQMEDGRWWELSRYYADFYDFQIALIETFPKEAGAIDGIPRTLPFMPGPVQHVTDAISNGRRQNLDEYIKGIVAMPHHISKSMLVRNLFKPRPGQDFEMDPNAMNEDYRLSGASQQSVQRLQACQPSLNQPASLHMSHQRQQASVTGPTAPVNGYGEASLPSQPGNSTQASHSSKPSNGIGHGNGNASSATPGSGGAVLKIKVYFQDEIIALRVPHNVAFRVLKERLAERLKVRDDIVIRYKDEQTNSYVDLDNDDSLDVALQRNPKLTLFVSDAGP
ncbi:hypothetical protein DV737_g3072, partial [Chaetothyriales sp. CBS 132003]